MPEETETIKAPAHLPKSLQQKWLKAHADALKQAKQDHPDSESTARAVAIREANKLQRIEEPADYEAAKALVDAKQADKEEGWKVIAHGMRTIGGEEHLSIVTANGKKHVYKVPKK